MPRTGHWYPRERGSRERDKALRLSTVKEQYYLVFELFNPGPPAHDKSIIGSDNSNDIDTLFFEFVVLGEELGKVLFVAGGLHSEIRQGLRRSERKIAL